MNRIYVSPAVSVEEATATNIIAASGVNSNNGIGYGGVDNNGEQVPSVKEHGWDSIWE